MNLKSISLKNYRSVEDLKINVNQLIDNSKTFGLIGINEAGKSSILRGYNLINLGINDIKPKDYFNNINEISLIYEYELTDNVLKNFNLFIKKKFPDLIIKQIDVSNISIKVSLKQNTNDFTNELIINKEILGNKISFEIDSELSELLKEGFHKTIFWSSEPKYLITDAIDLIAFSMDPDNISVPLHNCFKLAGIKDIKQRISLLSDSTEIESLRDELSEKVTSHIKRVWPKHPVKITFHLTESKIHFHVKDENSKSKSKTADQRSDGFKRFISFLLTLSAENANSELKNTIILLDEPETHLHPKAQEDLLKELVAITKANNNIVFFATHSNYMIDKTILSRNYKVSKPKEITLIEQFNDKQSSYASVNYDVFEIASTDYHNELYGKAQELSEIENGTAFDSKIQELIENCPSKNYIHSNGKKFDCTLTTYIRHLIHHPENTRNKKFTDIELEKSISILIELINKLKKPS